MSKMKKGDIVTIMTGIGEYIGKLNQIDGDNVVADNPRLIVQDPEGNIGFGRGVCMSAKENPEQVTFLDVLFVVETNESFQKSYIEATSGIII